MWCAGRPRRSSPHHLPAPAHRRWLVTAPQRHRCCRPSARRRLAAYLSLLSLAGRPPGHCPRMTANPDKIPLLDRPPAEQRRRQQTAGTPAQPDLRRLIRTLPAQLGPYSRQPAQRHSPLRRPVPGRRFNWRPYAGTPRNSRPPMDHRDDLLTEMLTEPLTFRPD